MNTWDLNKSTTNSWTQKKSEVFVILFLQIQLFIVLFVQVSSIRHTFFSYVQLFVVIFVHVPSFCLTFFIDPPIHCAFCSSAKYSSYFFSEVQLLLNEPSGFPYYPTNHTHHLYADKTIYTANWLLTCQVVNSIIYSKLTFGFRSL